MTAPNARLVIVAVIIVALSAMTGTVNVTSPATTQSAEITIEATTTETDAPVNGMVYGEQPIELHLEYTGLGSGTHDLELAEEDSLFDNTVREFSVEGDSGSETFHLSADELAETKDTGPEDMAHLYVGWGDEGKSNTLGIWWQETTVYPKGYGQLPDTVGAGEEVTVEYYGWTSQSDPHVRLMEDDRPHDNDLGGNDEQIRRDPVSGPGQFDGSFTFTPSDYIDGDNELEIQARAEGERQFPDLVRGITAAEPKTEIDAQIVDFSPSSGEYSTGEEVTSQVEVENTGNTPHTFFVGYGVIDEDGNSYDNEQTTGTTVTLDAGERDTVTVSWTVEEDAPTGGYSAGAAVWEESNSDNLETRLDDARVQAAFDVVSADTEWGANETVDDSSEGNDEPSIDEDDGADDDTTGETDEDDSPKESGDETEDRDDEAPDEPDKSRLTATVLGPAGEPVEGATITGEGEPHEADIPLEFSGETDSGGQYTNIVYENTYTIEVNHPNYEATTIDHTHNGEQEVRIEFEHESEIGTSLLTLTVTGPDGEPIKGAEVHGEGEPQETDIPLTFDGETDENGEYTDEIYENEYTIQVTHPDYEDESVSHTHDEESAVTVKLESEGGEDPSGNNETDGEGEGDEEDKESDGGENTTDKDASTDEDDEDTSDGEMSDDGEEEAITAEDTPGFGIIAAILVLLVVSGLIAARYRTN